MNKSQLWQPIKTAPNDDTIVDLWDGKYGERLTNYYRVKISGRNVFYEPMEFGPSVVRTATHWMSIPGAPDNEDAK